ncbi:alpha/beta fold hydrolase [uncultured Shewanella sp.]|uniref:alpha/beta fold hydrolase n=1 Tax=uncultured Shewanella sp. TaxID=173975 RepID=UPI002615DB65|nr:alpha/beta fold hydrolase [uncultured Shewanella sp.]
MPRIAPRSSKLEPSTENVRQFSSENQIDSPKLDIFWKEITESVLLTANKLHLAYCFIKHPNSTRAIVISNGRVESYLKYKELIFDLYQQGYSVYAIDHRGQGLSSRITLNPQQGHIDKFSTYIDDFSFFIDKVVLPQQHKTLFLLGHSMGCTIGTLYMQKAPNTFTAAAFSSPMYGIKLPISRRFIRWLAEKLDNRCMRREPNYILGGKDYEATPFSKNHLSHSQERYHSLLKLYQQHPQIQLGAPTNHWLVEAIDAAEEAVLVAQNPPAPLLILQAGRDTIVDNRSQNRAAGILTKICTSSTHQQIQLISIPDASHEIFIEKDKPRSLALNSILDFFALHA